QEFKGLRIITLDSAQDDHHEGKISELQMEQLRDYLAKPSEKGTLLLQHHPLVWEEEGISTEVPDGFK
ncbi:metallophosphoesterase family protein, partial [Staphylococcus aureus]